MGHMDARADGELAISIAAVDDTLFPQVTVVFTVDDGGRPVTRLAPADVTVTEGSAPASIVSVQAAVDDTMPLALVVAIDSSGSMAGAPIERAREAASSLVGSLGSGDSAALIAFADAVRPIQPLTTNKGDVAKGLAGLQANGNTALYDAVAESARIATESGLERKAVILLADGEDFGNRSKLTREQSLARAAEGGAIFYVIGVGSEIDRAYLDELAARSGGRFFEARGAADIPAIYASLEQILRSQFVATFRATSPAEPQDRSLTVNVRSGSMTGSASRAYQSRRPAGTSAAAAVEAAGPSEPQGTGSAAADESPSSTGSGVPLPLLFLPVLLLAAAVAVWANGSLRPRRATPTSGPPIAPVAAARSVPGLGGGTLTLLDNSAPGMAYGLSSGPTVIGSGEGCGIQLPESPGVSAQHARVWLRDSRPMVHHLAPGFITTVNGESVSFASLSDGDRIEIGPHTFVYAAGSDTGSENRGRRSEVPPTQSAPTTGNSVELTSGQ